MKNIRILGAFLLLLGITREVKAQQKFTLEGAISYAIQNNLQLKQAKLTEALDRESITGSYANLLPDLNASVQQSNQFGRSLNPTSNTYTNSNSHFLQGSLNGQVVLFGGLQKLNFIKQNKYQLEADQGRVERAKNDAVLNVLTYYLQVLSFQDLIVSIKQKSDVSKLQLDNDQKKLDVGNITEADLLQDKAQYAQDIQTMTTYQNNLDIARTNLQQYMNLDLTQTFTVVRPDSVVIDGIKTEYNALDVLAKAQQVLPNIKIEEDQARVYKSALDVARAAYYPLLTLGTSISDVYSPAYRTYGTPAPTGNLDPTPYVTSIGKDPILVQRFTFPSSSVKPLKEQLKNNLGKYYGFTLSIPIFNGWQTRINVRKAKINLSIQQLNAEIARTTLNKTIVQAVIDLRAADKKLAADHSSSESLKRSFYYSQQRYNVGLLNSLDFNLAKSKYTVAEATEIQDKYDLIFKAKVIDFYLGNKITL